MSGAQPISQRLLCPPRMLPWKAEGTHVFSGSKLLQAGRYTAAGAWVGGDVRTGAAMELL
jgi:hypothetical protein